jgi:DNA invertase Pin-like site-specific DNA recombinase
MNSTNTEDTEVRAGCYCRISSDPDDKREGTDRQRQDTAVLCEVKGWQVTEVYVDDDRSASNGKKRPEWDRLLADIKAGKIDAIAAWDQDRNWCMMAELEDLRKFFNSLGREIKLATTGQGEIDLYSPTGVMMAQIKTAVSEHEIAMMKIRQRRAHRQRAERGKPKWRKAFGYLPYLGDKKDDDGIRQIDPVTGPLVKEAYRQILSGASLYDICKLFNGKGAYGLNGKPWTRSTVSLFLRDPRNAALRSYKGQLVTGEDGSTKAAWPALVDAKTWHAVQDKINSPARKPNKKTVRKHLLTGVLHCGKPDCGGTLGGYVTAKGFAAYRCRKCLGLAVRSADIEPAIIGAVGTRLAQPDAVDLLKAPEHDEATAAKIRTDLAVLYARLEQIGIDVGEGLLTGQQAKAATDTVQAKIAKLEASQQDQEKLAVLDGIPLGTPEAVDAVAQLSPDRFRAVANLLMAPVVLPVGKGSHVFNPQRVLPGWK